MRRFFTLTCVTFLITIWNAFPQEDSVLSFLPLEIGNLWQYKIHYMVNNSNIDTTYFSLFTLTRDTIMPNGYQYQVITGNQGKNYVHIDTVTYCAYEYDYNSTRGIMTDSLNCSEGDWFGNGIYCEQIDTSTVLGYTTTIMKVNSNQPDISEIHTLATDIGVVYREIVNTIEYGSTITYELIYANINGLEFGELVSNVNGIIKTINSFSLYQNYPNPFNPVTTIKYQISELSSATLKVYDVLGNEVWTLISEEKPAGEYVIEFNATEISTGIYIYQLRAGNFTQTKKMILLR